jgi:hypothetical protein
VEGIFRKRLKRSALSEYAINLYDHEDKDIRYIQDVMKIVVPVLELYQNVESEQLRNGRDCQFH